MVNEIRTYIIFYKGKKVEYRTISNYLKIKSKTLPLFAAVKKYISSHDIVLFEIII